MRAAGFVISEEGEFEIVENPFIWQLLKRRRRKCVGKIKINLMDMCCENEMGLAHSICMEMSGSITREMDIQFLHAVSCCTLLLVL